MTRLSAELMAQVRESCERWLGFAAGQLSDSALHRGLAALAEHRGASIAESASALLLERLSDGEKQCVLDELTIGETYFMREPRAFDVLKDDLLPRWLERAAPQQVLRILSVGCATGEEAYSVAALLHRVGLGPRAQVLGVDVNARFIAQARRASYGAWSLRTPPQWLLQDCLRLQGDGRFEVLPAIRELVRFELVNLIDDKWPGPERQEPHWDFILCRNVLIYLNEDKLALVLDRAAKALASDGRLALGAAELGCAAMGGHPFASDGLDPWLLHRKAAGTARALEAVATPKAALPPLSRPLRGTAALPLRPAAVAPASQAVNDPLAEVRALADRGDYEGALRRLSSASPTAERYLLEGMILQSQQRSVAAFQAFRRALFLDPHLHMAQVARGQLESAAGDSRAQRKLRQALGLPGPQAKETAS